MSTALERLHGTQATLFPEPYVVSTPAIKLNPATIRVERISIGQVVSFQRVMSKAVWRPAPGRKLAFLVKSQTNMLGLIVLVSPVINLAARDQHLDLPKDASDKGKALRKYADMSVCVAAQPFGWHWNGGKLIASIATTLGDHWHDQYGDTLRGITTTSLWGKGSQYNRLYKFLGYTKGFGHEHISDDDYAAMISWMRRNNVPIPSCRFGDGSNARMRRIAAYRKASGDKTVTLVHGNKRGIYYHEAVPPTKRSDVIDAWYSRWGLPRYERTRDQQPPYRNGLT